MCFACGEESAAPEVCLACFDDRAAVTGWIACSEGRYPSVGERVLLAWRSPDAPPASGEPFTYTSWLPWMERGGVTHWMRIAPVPEVAR